MTDLAAIRAALARLDGARASLDRVVAAPPTHPDDPQYGDRARLHCERAVARAQRDAWPLLESFAREAIAAQPAPRLQSSDEDEFARLWRVGNERIT